MCHLLLCGVCLLRDVCWRVCVCVFVCYVDGVDCMNRWSYGVMVSTLDFESSDPGSNPGRTSFLRFGGFVCCMASEGSATMLEREAERLWSYGVMVSTLDSESSDPGSNPGRTSF